MELITLNNDPLPELMEAVVLEKPFHLKYTKIPMWPIDTYEDSDLMLLKVKACGVCGSDFRYYQGENPWAQHTKGVYLENPLNIVLGHEYAGEVVAVLDEKNRKWLGKRVVPICSKVCGKCIYCQSNRTHLCENTIHMGHGQGWGELSYFPGAYAEYAPAWVDGCYEIPPNVTNEEAAVMDVLAVSSHAYNQANHRAELPVLLMGAGPILNGVGQVLKICGVENEKIVILENSDVAINVAQETGFQNIINTTNINEQEIIEKIQKLSKNQMIFSVFDSIGTALSFNIGLKVLDKGGSYVNLAVHDQEVKNFNQMQLSSERKITTSSNFSLLAYERAWGWLQGGKFTINPWFTRISLENVPKIFKETIMDPKNKSHFKLVILPNKNE